MSKWITDRKPTKKDALEDNGLVWWWYEAEKEPIISSWEWVGEGQPWMPIIPPDPYVKPKRWFVVWSDLFGGWSLRGSYNGGVVHLFDPILKSGLSDNTDEHREAAERIAAIYEEVMP